MKMSREQYADYLRTQAWWITELAAEIQEGGDGSTNSWGVDFELLKPEDMRDGLPYLPLEGMNTTA
jgi:hypothetical protein